MIIVFARAPVPGQAKTRLAPRLGDWRAAQLQARLTRHAVQTALAARCGPVELHATRRHRFFDTLGVALRMQKGNDLGERMHRALAKARRPAILIGTDCPMLTPADLRRALRWLQGGCEVVLAPAEDGGYALIGARRVRRQFFENVPWGGALVYEETKKRLAGYRWRALARVWDVDRPKDLERLAALPLAVKSLRFASAARRGARR